MYKLNLPKPETNRKLIEVVLNGRIGKWLYDKGNWAGTTLVFPFFVVILYYLGEGVVSIDPAVRLHECQHVFQADNEFFLVWWFKYLSQTIKGFIKTHNLMMAYSMNKYEIQAYQVENDTVDGKLPWPKWAK